MVAVVLAFPSLALHALGPKKELDVESIRLEVPSDRTDSGTADGKVGARSPDPAKVQEGGKPGTGPNDGAQEDLGAALMRSLRDAGSTK
jgi:hypothetical protein